MAQGTPPDLPPPLPCGAWSSFDFCWGLALVHGLVGIAQGNYVGWVVPSRGTTWSLAWVGVDRIGGETGHVEVV